MRTPRSTILKESRLSTTQWGIVALVADAVGIVFTAALSKFDETFHRPRILGISLLFTTLGALVFVSPHFLIAARGLLPSGLGIFAPSDMCNAPEASLAAEAAACSAPAGIPPPLTMLLFILGQSCFAVGGAVLWIHGPIYFDLNLSAEASKFLGIVTSVTKASVTLSSF